MHQCPSCGGFCAKSGCERVNVAQSAPGEAAREYMTGYSDGREWAGATNLAQPERAPLTESEISKLVMPYGFSSIQGFDHIKAYTRRVEAYIKQGGQHG